MTAVLCPGQVAEHCQTIALLSIVVFESVQREHLDRMLGGRNRQLSGRMDSMSSVGSVSERSLCFAVACTLWPAQRCRKRVRRVLTCMLVCLLDSPLSR